MKRMMAATVGSLLLAIAPANAEKLPSTLSWTAYDVGSSGYNNAVAIGNALKNKMGVNLRVVPGKNDISRMVPLREQRVQFSATGLASFFSMEGVYEFGAKEWGPQETRILLTANADSNLALGTAKDAGIRTLKDLKGKRLAWVLGAPALNENLTAMLAFAGLTWDDVQKVEFPGFGQSWQGLVNGQADAAWSQTTSGPAYQLESSKRGIFWPPVPHSDKEGWARMKKVGPFFAPHVATLGAGVSKDNPHEGATYPYPILTTYVGQEDSLVYGMAKAMVDLYPEYKDGAPGADGWALDRQIFEWVVPYHEAAVRVFREKGAWKPEHQAHNDKLVARQKVLGEAWKSMEAKKSLADDAFKAEWRKVRAAALSKAGFDPYWQ